MAIMETNKSERKRVSVVFLIFAVWVIAIATALVKVQVFDYAKHVNKVRAQSNRTFELHPKRGTIYDANGEVLAISVKARSAFLSNKDNTDSFRLLNEIVRRHFPLTRSDRKNIRKRIGRGDKFIWLKRKLDEEEFEILEKVRATNKGMSELDYIEEYKRIYPQNTLASHILGGVGIDEQGLYGIEYSLDSTIRGKGGKAKVVQDARQKVFKLQYLTPPVPGRDIYLTLDSSVQFFVEQELEKAVNQHNARAGSVIVMDSQTGDILAMACYPTFHPGNVNQVPVLLTRNNAISFQYHPGSTFKIVLASTALEQNICSPQRMFNCYNGSYRVRDEVITDVHAYDRLSFEDIIIYSSNIGAAKIGERLGRKRWYAGICRFGFGQSSGLRLPGEENGILHPLNEWTGVSLAFSSHGYDLAVTPLQMARAFNVLASGGYLIQPQVLKKIDGAFLKGNERQRILSDGTVQRMVSILSEVVDRGTGKKARIEDIVIAGKTGTTKKIPKPGRKVTKRKYIASFGGFLPAKKPRITMFVMIDEPKGVYYGGDVAAPVYKSIAERLMIYLKIFPELDRKNEIKL